jgi:hypothetical protein
VSPAGLARTRHAPETPRKILDPRPLPDILVSVSAQAIGIVLSVFSALVAVGIYWGGFQEEKRSAVDTEALTKG